MIHLIQMVHPSEGRRAAVVEDENLRLLRDHRSLYALVLEAMEKGSTLADEVDRNVGDTVLEYNFLYGGSSPWKLLPSFDHPFEPSRCLVSGTGLTHRKSAANRDAMHQGTEPRAEITDSMRMYQWGAEGGRPEPGAIGTQPEWFYKGTGHILRAHGEPLEIHGFAEDGGEEPEIAGVYAIAPDGMPVRVGFTTANEFSDHRMERRNYLYLAPSKLRTCAIGPELVSGTEFDNVDGTVKVERNGSAIWSHEISTGEANMVHSLANMEYHHFKYPAHRIPGDVHIHFFGADAFSFGDGIELQDGDAMEVRWDGFGRSLRNPVRIDPKPAQTFSVRAI